LKQLRSKFTIERMKRKKGFRLPLAAVFPLVLCTAAVGLGAVVLTRSLMFSPEITIDSKERRSPIRDNMQEAEAYNQHRKFLSRFDTYIKRPDMEKSSSAVSKREER